jgi:hypothetical protein
MSTPGPIGQYKGQVWKITYYNNFHAESTGYTSNYDLAANAPKLKGGANRDKPWKAEPVDDNLKVQYAVAGAGHGSGVDNKWGDSLSHKTTAECKFNCTRVLVFSSS